MIPSFLPRISKELAALLIQPPRWQEAFFSGMPRSNRIASANTSSATERVLEYGALNTAMPRSRAALRSTWLVPMQKQPTATSFLAWSKISSVSCVRERIPMKWASAIFSFNWASGKEPVRYSILTYPEALRTSTADWWTPSRRRNLILLLSREVLLICVNLYPGENWQEVASRC